MFPQYYIQSSLSNMAEGLVRAFEKGFKNFDGKIANTSECTSPLWLN